MCLKRHLQHSCVRGSKDSSRSSMTQTHIPIKEAGTPIHKCCEHPTPHRKELLNGADKRPGLRKKRREPSGATEQFHRGRGNGRAGNS